MCELTDANFNEGIKDSKLAVLVDFWAPWCGSCRMIAPIVEKIAKEYEGKIKICKANVDDSPNVSETYGIRSIPTLIIFKDGKLVEQMVGAMPEEDLKNKIAPYLVNC
ncbi:MAG: thioredoxin [bacterium]|nr:thioredoxin [bacterium]